jgi:isoamylase
MHAGVSLRGSSGQTSAVGFAVRSRAATAMSLLLARAPKPGAGQGKPTGCLEIALDPDVNRTGDLWHICVEVRLP